MDFENWKLSEVAESVNIISNNLEVFKTTVFDKFQIPLPTEYKYSRNQTEIDWKKMPRHYSFFLDDKDDDLIKKAIKSSNLNQTNNLFLTYNQNNIVVKIPFELFVNDWEDFISSQAWEGLIFSENFDLIIECSRDYFLHSNFKIW
ncbi:MAG: hypothetical protein WBF83_12580 [Moheibacter sp.]